MDGLAHQAIGPQGNIGADDDDRSVILDPLKKPINLTDKATGLTIRLTAEHLILLEQLSKHNDLS